LGVAELRGFLQRHRRIALDTSVFIYQIEANPRYVALAETVFEWLERPNHSALTSSITMMELLVQPYRDSNRERANRFYALLGAYPHLDWVAPSLEIADIAARLRAKHRFKPLDAIQAATAIKGGATALITNDAVLERVELFETAVLDRFHPNRNS
jgi:predicted nucleic acid-binding protein